MTTPTPYWKSALPVRLTDLEVKAIEYRLEQIEAERCVSMAECNLEHLVELEDEQRYLSTRLTYDEQRNISMYQLWVLTHA